MQPSQDMIDAGLVPASSERYVPEGVIADVPDVRYEDAPVAPGRIEAFKKAGGPRKLERLIDEAVAIAQGRMDFSDKADRLIDVAGRISSLIVPFTPCGKGCNHCCSMATAVSRHEAEMIGRYLGRNIAPIPGVDLMTFSVTMERQQMVDKYTGVPCTLLGDDGKCTVYPVRPIACRTHHNLAVDESNCVISKDLKVRRSTPALNINDYLMVQAKAFFEGGQAFADIREWFPQHSHTDPNDPTKESR